MANETITLVSRSHEKGDRGMMEDSLQSCGCAWWSCATRASPIPAATRMWSASCGSKPRLIVLNRRGSGGRRRDGAAGKKR